MGLEFVLKEQGFWVVGYAGEETMVAVPEQVDGTAVVGIGAKAFLSCNSIRILELPATIEKIEDWAFCHMKQLEILRMGQVPKLGRQVFKGCNSLKKIDVCEVTRVSELIPKAMPFWPEALETLGELNRKGCSQSWLELFDRRLTEYLGQPDDKDFVPGFVGWFDDTDVDVDRKNWVEKTRTEKILLILMRGGIPGEGMPEDFGKYLLCGENLPIVEKVLCESPVSRLVSAFKVFERIGGFEKLSPAQLLQKMPEPEPEVASFLLNAGQVSGIENNFFENLEL